MSKLTIDDALKSANDICRSAFAIAERSGKNTNWKAFSNKVKGSLHLQHKVMVESGMFDQRNMAATIPQKIETEFNSLRTELAKKDERIKELDEHNECRQIVMNELGGRLEASEAKVRELEEMSSSLRAVNNEIGRRLEVEEAKVMELEADRDSHARVLQNEIAKNARLLEALETAVNYIEEDGHSCEFYINPEAGHCSFCEMMADLKQAIKENNNANL